MLSSKKLCGLHCEATVWQLHWCLIYHSRPAGHLTTSLTVLGTCTSTASSGWAAWHVGSLKDCATVFRSCQGPWQPVSQRLVVWAAATAAESFKGAGATWHGGINGIIIHQWLPYHTLEVFQCTGPTGGCCVVWLWPGPAPGQQPTGPEASGGYDITTVCVQQGHCQCHRDSGYAGSRLFVQRNCIMHRHWQCCDWKACYS